MITTSRLYIRQISLDDSNDRLELFNDDELIKYLVSSNNKATQEDIKSLIQKAIDKCSDVFFEGSIVYDNRVIGGISYKIEGHKAQIGYFIGKNWRNNGFATEAVMSIVNHLISKGSVYRIEALCHVNNKASLKVLDKSGFLHEGTLRKYKIFPNLSECPQDVDMFSIVMGC
jgi:[ribosomal protein S5]-alanine N-acetyltransferase